MSHLHGFYVGAGDLNSGCLSCLHSQCFMSPLHYRLLKSLCLFPCVGTTEHPFAVYAWPFPSNGSDPCSVSSLIAAFKVASFPFPALEAALSLGLIATSRAGSRRCACSQSIAGGHDLGALLLCVPEEQASVPALNRKGQGYAGGRVDYREKLVIFIRLSRRKVTDLFPRRQKQIIKVAFKLACLWGLLPVITDFWENCECSSHGLPAPARSLARLPGHTTCQC